MSVFPPSNPDHSQSPEPQTKASEDVSERRIFKRLEQDTHFCFSILLFSFTLVCPSSLFPLCVETIFIPRVPQSRHNWWRNARSESINPFYPSVTPLHGPPQFIFPAQNRALLYSILLYKLQLITASFIASIEGSRSFTIMEKASDPY